MLIRKIIKIEKRNGSNKKTVCPLKKVFYISNSWKIEFKTRLNIDLKKFIGSEIFFSYI